MLLKVGDKKSSTAISIENQNTTIRNAAIQRAAALTTLLGLLRGMHSTMAGTRADAKDQANKAAREASMKAQFGNVKSGGGTVKGNNSLGFLKSMGKMLSGIGPSIAKGILSAKAKMWMFLIGLIGMIVAFIWLLVKFPGLREKLWNWMKGVGVKLWNMWQKFWTESGPKAKAIVLAIASIMGLIIFGPWGLLVGAVMLIAGLWPKYKALIIGIGVAAAVLGAKWLAMIAKQKFLALKASKSMIATGLKTSIRFIATVLKMVAQGVVLAIQAMITYLGPIGMLIAAIALIAVIFIAVIVKFRKQIWGAIKKVGKWLWEALQWLLFFPWKLLFTLFPGLGKKIKDAIFGLFSKIPFVGKFFRKDGKDETDNVPAKVEAKPKVEKTSKVSSYSKGEAKPKKTETTTAPQKLEGAVSSNEGKSGSLISQIREKSQSAAKSGIMTATLANVALKIGLSLKGIDAIRQINSSILSALEKNTSAMASIRLSINEIKLGLAGIGTAMAAGFAAVCAAVVMSNPTATILGFAMKASSKVIGTVKKSKTQTAVTNVSGGVLNDEGTSNANYQANTPNITAGAVRNKPISIERSSLFNSSSLVENKNAIEKIKENNQMAASQKQEQMQAESAGKFSENMQMLPDIIALGLAKYFDNKELRLAGEESNSLAITKSDNASSF